MAEKSYKASKRGITLGKRIGMKNLILLTIFISICVHIHIFGFRKIHGQSRRTTGTIFSTENFKRAYLSP